MRRALAAVLVVGAAACTTRAPTIAARAPLADAAPAAANAIAAPLATEAPEPPRVAPAIRLRDGLATGDARPEVVASRRIDAERLPLARWEEPDEGSRARVTRVGPEAFQFFVDEVSFAQFTIDYGFSAFTGTDFYNGSWPGCPNAQKMARAAWRGFSQHGWTDAGVDVVMSVGSFSFESCRASPDTTLRARAAAVVPGFVYALRIVDAGSTSLWLMMPGTALASATSDDAASGSFTMASLPLEPHRNAAAAFRISPAALKAFRTMRRTRDAAPRTEVTKDSLLLAIEVQPGRAEDLAVSISLALPRSARASDYAAIVEAVRSPG